MRRLLAISGALLLAGILCLSQQEHVSAFWQTRDSNYNINVTSGGGGSIGTPHVLAEAYAPVSSLTTSGFDAPIGSLNVIWTWVTSGTPATTLTDSASNTYAQAVSFQYATSGTYCTIYYSSNTTHDWPIGGTISLGATISGGGAITITGANSGLDAAKTGSSTNGSPTLSSGTLGQAVEFVVADVMNDQNFGTPSGFSETLPFTTFATQWNAQGVDVGGAVTSSTAAITYAPTWSSGAVQGPVCLASFKH